MATVLSAVVLLGYSDWAHHRGLRLPGMPQPSAAVPLPHADNTHDYAGFAKGVFVQRFTSDALAALIGAVLDPAGYVMRISEELTLEEEHYQQTLTRTVRAASPGWLLVPVLRPRKGVLVDELHVTVDGKAATTLSYAESEGAMVVVLETLFEAVFPEDSRTEKQRLLLRRVLDAAVSDAAWGRKQIDALCQDLRAIMPMGDPPRPDDSTASAAPDYREPLVQLAGSLASSYCIIVPVKGGETDRVKIELTRRLRRHNRLDRFSDRLRVILGLNVRTHLLVLPHSLEAVSYHLRTRAPDGMYVYDAAPRPIAVKYGDTAVHSIAPHGRSRMPVLRLNNPEGLEYIHLYGRDLESLQSEPAQSQTTMVERALALRLEFREKPPGMLAIVLVLSMYLAGLTWAVGHFHDLVFPPPTPGAEPAASSWPTILFGIPALISGWLVSRFSADALRKVSLATVGMTLWLVSNAAAAVLIAALKTSGASTDGLEVGSLVVTHLTWGLLMASTGLHLALSLLMALGRAARYLRRASRAIAAQGEEGHH